MEMLAQGWRRGVQGVVRTKVRNSIGGIKITGWMVPRVVRTVVQKMHYERQRGAKRGATDGATDGAPRQWLATCRLKID